MILKFVILLFTIANMNASAVQNDSMTPFFVEYFPDYVKNIAVGLQRDFPSTAKNILKHIENFNSSKKADFSFVIDNIHSEIGKILSNQSLNFSEKFDTLKLKNLCHKYQIGSNSRVYLIKKFLIERSAYTMATYDQILASKIEFTYFVNFYKLFLLKCYIDSEPEYLIDSLEFNKSTQDFFEQFISFRRTRLLTDKSYKNLVNSLNDFEEFYDFSLSEEEIKQIVETNFFLWDWDVEFLLEPPIESDENDFITVSQTNRTIKLSYEEKEKIDIDFSNHHQQKSLEEYFILSSGILGLENFDETIDLPLIYLFKIMDLVYDDSGNINNNKKEALLKADYELFKYLRLNDMSGVEDLNQKYVQNQFNKKKCSCSCNIKISGYFYLSEYKAECDFYNFSKRNYTCYLPSCYKGLLDF